MAVKLIFLSISLILGILGITQLNRLPSEKYTRNGNYWRVVIFSSVGCFYDIIMFVVICRTIPPGEYGTGIEILAMIAVLLFYTPACVITSKRLKQRMKAFQDPKHDVSRMNCLNCSVLFKVMFIMVETIWLVEVK